MKVHFQDISDREFGLMHEAVLRLLSDYGVLYEHEEAHRLMKRAGNSIDADGRAHLEPSFVESMLKLVPRDGFTLYGRDESRRLPVAADRIAFRSSTGTPFILDYDTRCARPANLNDAKTMALLTDALEGFDMVNCAVNPAGSPHGVGTLHLLINAHRYSMKPSDVTVMTRQEVQGVARIAAAIRGGEKALREKPLTAVDVAMITPLRCAGEQVEALLECAQWGIPIEVLTSPAMGLTAPVTLAGSVAVNIAEMIAALCLVYLVAPGLGMINTARISPVNMHTAMYNLGMPEQGMGSLLVSLCCARYGIPVDAYGFGTVATLPGIQVTMEKAFSGLLMALGRPFMVTGGGMLKNALVTSPEQLVIDNEAIRFLRRIRRPIAIDEPTIGIDTLIRGMKGGSLLMEGHTIEHLRKGELMQCGLGQWNGNSGLESAPAPDLLERAHSKVEEILASHKVEPFDPSLEREIDKIIESTV
jgi:trimethylamine---corrinoid protein Co-methyltransferase